MRLVEHVSAKLRDANFKMLAVLSVQLDVSVCTQESQLRVIVR